jgi:hypothetical protein
MDEAIERARRDPAALGRRVIIVDDGFEDLAAGLAERLATAGGAAVRIVSPRPWWGESLYRTYDMSYVMPRLRAANVAIEAQTFVEAIAAGSATLYDVWNAGERRTVEADSVVLATAWCWRWDARRWPRTTAGDSSSVASATASRRARSRRSSTKARKWRVASEPTHLNLFSQEEGP